MSIGGTVQIGMLPSGLQISEARQVVSQEHIFPPLESHIRIASFKPGINASSFICGVARHCTA